MSVGHFSPGHLPPGQFPPGHFPAWTFSPLEADISPPPTLIVSIFSSNKESGGPHSLSLVLKVGNLATLWIGLGWGCSDGLPLLPHHLLAECMMSLKSLIIHGVAS